MQCDHIELRWKNCQTVLPPSLHPSGGTYKFCFLRENDFPSSSPYQIPADRIEYTLSSLCVMPEVNVNANRKEKSGAAPRVVQTDSYISDNALQNITACLSGRLNNYDDWMRTGFALASLGERGREHFIRISRTNPAYQDTEESLNKKFDGLLKDYKGDIKTGTLFTIAKKYGYLSDEKHFWKMMKKRVRISINSLISFLEAEGFAKMFINREYIFIKETNNVISEISKVNIKDYLINYVNMHAEGTLRAMILEKLLRNTNLCSEHILECIKTVTPDFVREAKDKAYFFFANCFAEVNIETIKLKDYSELPGKIWSRQITPRELSPEIFNRVSEGIKCEFALFLENVCRSGPERFSALKSAIGYLLHSYKDPSCAKAIIFTDEKLSENAFGRSGKGLAARAVSLMKNVLKIDGKNFTFEKNFVFQSVDPDTQLIIFDDVKKKFSFDKLFSILTEGITIEKKNKGEYRVPYDKSPKVLITTNHTVEGIDDSSLDRQFVVEFSDYYNAQYKPKDDLGHLLFDEWDDEQWNVFYVFMLECCMLYLKHGLKSYKYVNLTKKKLIDTTAPEFEEFIRSLALNTEYNRREIYEQFKKEYPDFGQLKQQTFSKWTSAYVNLFNLDITERKSGHERYITITRNTKPEQKQTYQQNNQMINNRQYSIFNRHCFLLSSSPVQSSTGSRMSLQTVAQTSSLSLLRALSLLFQTKERERVRFRINLDLF